MTGHLGDNCVPVSTRLGRDFVCAALVGWATLGQRHYLTALFSGWCCPPTADNGCVVRLAERSPQKLCSPPLLPPYSQGVPWAWVRIVAFCAPSTGPHNPTAVQRAQTHSVACELRPLGRACRGPCARSWRVPVSPAFPTKTAGQSTDARACGENDRCKLRWLLWGAS